MSDVDEIEIVTRLERKKTQLEDVKDDLNLARKDGGYTALAALQKIVRQIEDEISTLEEAELATLTDFGLDDTEDEIMAEVAEGLCGLPRRQLKKLVSLLQRRLKQ